MQEVKHYTALDQSVIKTLLYYDIFDYPLKANEVFRFLGINSVTETDVIDSLDTLAGQGGIHRFEEFYSLQPDEATVIRRIRGNKVAEKFISIAQQKAFFISKFPFVRAVMASGSLSKGYMDEASDLDFFIVTAPNRLWIARTLLVLYKRIFLNNSHKLFCVNYFVDTAHLEIEEKNLFTATELATVIPLYGGKYYQQLHRSNPWLLQYFPNFKPGSIEKVPQTKISRWKKLLEKTIDILFGNIFENVFMALTYKRWKRVYQNHYNEADFKIAFKTKKYASKNHPKHFQKRVMDLYDWKLKQFGEKLEIEWNHE